MSSRAEECRRKARECELKAREATAAEARDMYHELAVRWEEIAEQIERSEFVTPSSR